ncbi:MAG: Gfo/Idh/MocA family oxidoreductase [Bacteroidaceae bacterium]|nr:Gfo/Idh/MocA family oxidoreductase [Bacteroidaceae bacterium]
MKTYNFWELFLISVLCCINVGVSSAQNRTEPLRLAVAGIAHGHLNDVISRMNRGDFKIVGVYEKDDRLREKNGLSRRLDKALFYADLDKMLDQTKPEAVVAYGSIFDHLAVVKACAPRGIHVMVEKPLAMNLKHAKRMAQLARKHNILLLTNYETSWYGSNHEAFRLIKEQNAIGNITRMLIYDGHQGPFEIGCGKEFTDWLTDPKLNGGGAIIDFGCYGANLATWMLDGQRPISIYAVTNHQKPGKYPKVDDDATILVQYPNVTVQIMPSWNWPMNRKDMYVYGSQGYIYQSTPTRLSLFQNGKERNIRPATLKTPYNDSFLYLKAAVRGEIQVRPSDLASLENNLIVVEILDAAVKSARKGKPIYLK